MIDSSTNVQLTSCDKFGSKLTDKRVLYFSDGTLELDISKEESVADTSQVAVDPKTMNWGPWMWYKTAVVGNKTLEVCDFIGESLASFFGITTPKYQFEINEYHRMKKAEEEATREKDLEMGGWTEKGVGEVISAQASERTFASTAGGDSISDGKARY